MPRHSRRRHSQQDVKRLARRRIRLRKGEAPTGRVSTVFPAYVRSISRRQPALLPGRPGAHPPNLKCASRKNIILSLRLRCGFVLRLICVLWRVYFAFRRGRCVGFLLQPFLRRRCILRLICVLRQAYVAFGRGDGFLHLFFLRLRCHLRLICVLRDFWRRGPYDDGTGQRQCHCGN